MGLQETPVGWRKRLKNWILQDLNSGTKIKLYKEI